MDLSKSEIAFKEAKKNIPGGVNSPVRSFKSIGMPPVFFAKGRGPILTDVDGNKYFDYCASWGVAIAGHAHPQVIERVSERIENGTTFGAPTLEETDLAIAIKEAFPSIEKIRFVSSGTEAVMSAIRLARGFTKRQIIIKFDGNYHGHSDFLLTKAGSGVAEISESSSQGVPEEFVKNTISVPYNDIRSIENLFKLHPKEIAAIIVEPIAANMGLVLPEPGFLQALSDITKKNKALLIFDEVISGFRVSLGGAQELFKITPDITTLGKIIGGGFPAGAFGGRADIMKLLAPTGPVYQAGTLSGNPVAMVAGFETLKLLKSPSFYHDLELSASYFYKHLAMITIKYPICVQHIGSMFTIFFCKKTPKNFAEVAKCDMEKFAAFYRALIHQGVYLSPSQYEANFISSTHSADVIIKTLTAIQVALKEVFPDIEAPNIVLNSKK